MAGRDLGPFRERLPISIGFPSRPPSRRPGRTVLYYQSVSAITGFILAGGKSSRMGCDKSLLVLGGRTLLERAVELVKTVTPAVGIVGTPAKFSSFGPVTNDVFPERGPLGGIHAALLSSPTDLNLVVAVDLPFLEPRFLTYLIKQAEVSQAVVTLARVAGHFQPLAAVYRKAFLAPAELALAGGRNKIDALFSEVSLRVVEERELTLGGYKHFMFSNLNTPQEWEWAQAEMQKGATRMPLHDR